MYDNLSDKIIARFEYPTNSRKLDCGGELWELDPVDDLPVHVEGEELGGGVLLPPDAVPHPDGGPWDAIQYENVNLNKC